MEAAGGPIQGDHCCVCSQKCDDIAQLYFYRVYSCRDEKTIVRECSVCKQFANCSQKVSKQFANIVSKQFGNCLETVCKLFPNNISHVSVSHPEWETQCVWCVCVCVCVCVCM